VPQLAAPLAFDFAQRKAGVLVFHIRQVDQHIAGEPGWSCSGFTVRGVNLAGLQDPQPFGKASRYGRITRATRHTLANRQLVCAGPAGD
jgi:hypothetical protein